MPSNIPSNNGLLGAISDNEEQGQPMVAPVIEGAAPVAPAATPTTSTTPAAPAATPVSTPADTVEDFWAADGDSLVGETEVINLDDDALTGTPGRE